MTIYIIWWKIQNSSKFAVKIRTCKPQKVTIVSKTFHCFVNDEPLKQFDDIENVFKICLKYKQPTLKPIAGFSLSKEFNDAVSVDLKQIKDVFHITDNATCFIEAAVVNSKRKKEIANDFIRYWIAILEATGVAADNITWAVEAKKILKQLLWLLPKLINFWTQS